MSKLGVLCLLSIMCLISSASAVYHVSYNFNTEWSGDYAPGWENSDYRHGEAPSGKMMDFYAGGRNGSSGMRLIADSTPTSSMFWVGVNPIAVDEASMQKQYNPWMSAWYYDEGWSTESSYNANLHRGGQIYAVPSWVNNYIDGTEDWTDIQFGARRLLNTGEGDNYYYVASGEDSPGWQDTGVARTAGWHQLKMQLSSNDGYVHFFVDGVEKGTTYRNDYVDLSTVGLYTMFTAPLSDWTNNKPWTIWDDFEVGSSIPEPATMCLLGLGGLLLRKKK